jgi:2-methylcitrate dehydratase PrpD
MSATGTIAAFIAEADYGQFPPEAIHLAKRSILDCLGVALAGSSESAGRIVVDYVRELGGAPLATVIKGGFKTSPPMAALANGTMAHALDYDDVFATGGGHASVSIVPAVVALGEASGASGRKLLEAYLVGFEVGARISAAIEPGHSEKGWHPTATVNALRAAAATAKMLNLHGDEIEHALGLAASLAGGLRLNIGTMTKPFHAGNASRNGIIACMLARKGFTAEKGILEQSPYGFCEIFSGDEKPDLEKLTEGLGTQFQIVSPGIGIKKYPCVAGIHSAIDAVLHLAEQYAVTPDMVEAITCGVRKMRPQTLRSQ